MKNVYRLFLNLDYMFTCINKISKDLKTGDKLPLIIADGGIHSNGDIAKALVAGDDKYGFGITGISLLNVKVVRTESSK